MAFLFIRLGFWFYSFARWFILVSFSGAEALEQICFLNKIVSLIFLFLFLVLMMALRFLFSEKHTYSFLLIYF